MVGSDKTQIRKVVQHGGSLWSTLFSLGAKALPFVSEAASKVLQGLATGALSALGSLGALSIRLNIPEFPGWGANGTDIF